MTIFGISGLIYIYIYNNHANVNLLFCRSRSQEGKSRGNRSNKSSKPFSNLMGGSRNVEGDRDDNSENGKSSWFGGGGPFLGSNAKKDGNKECD